MVKIIYKKTGSGLEPHGALMFSLLLLCTAAFGQDRRQVIRGKVTDAVTMRPLGNCVIALHASESYSTVSDSTGVYHLEAPVGKYSLVAEKQGYRSLLRDNVVLLAGKQQVQDLEMQLFRSELETVVVNAQGSSGREVGLDQWNMQHFAAVFYDPARVVYSHAGAINIDDGTNQTTVRGTSPGYIQWKLEEVEIVNPNHLENAGTINDRPALNGGGVSLISAQLMENSQFQFAPFDATSGNALSGLFNMRLRKGNNEKYEHIVQASLLGTDISTEGPFRKGGAASYLLNFRYSTIGLLTKMGVDFGEEKTNFYDLSHMIFLPYRSGSVKIFGINGASTTTFEGKRDTADIEIQKDLQDIDYRSATTINGISMTNRLSSSVFIKTVLAYSAKTTARSSEPLGKLPLVVPEESDRLQQEKLSSLNYVSSQLSQALSMKAGLYLNYFSTSLKSSVNAVYSLKGKIFDPIAEPFVAFEGRFSEKLEYTAGLHTFYQSRINYFNVQPRASLKWRPAASQQLSFSYGASSQLQSAFLYIATPSNRNLLPTTNDALSLAHSIKFLSAELKSELYYQYYRNVPEESVTGFSGFNYFNEQVFISLSQGGLASLYGCDLRLEKNFRDMYFIVSSSVYNSQFKNPGAAWKTARFNTGYNFFLTAGKEYRIRNKDNFFGLDMRAMYRGGFLETPAFSNLAYDYTSRLPEYWRADLRVSYKKNKVRSSVIWALDIQNITNRRNVSYHYNDIVTGKTETKTYLGLIPVLSYKVMF